MNRFGLLSLIAALAACIPCVLLPTLAATGPGATFAVLRGWLGMPLAIPLTVVGSAVTLGAVFLLHRRSCEVA